MMCLSGIALCYGLIALMLSYSLLSKEANNLTVCYGAQDKLYTV